MASDRQQSCPKEYEHRTEKKVGNCKKEGSTGNEIKDELSRSDDICEGSIEASMMVNRAEVSTSPRAGRDTFAVGPLISKQL